jgi:citrate lyase subunit gamma (acyl carrier protein)
MEITKEAMCGTLESNDLLVKVAPGEGGLEVVVESEVLRQFGAQIRRVVLEVLARMDVTRGQVIIEDKGALDCAIRARVQAAVLRGADSGALDWEVLS